MRARARGEEGGMSIFGKKHKLVLAKKIAITAPASLMGTCGYPHHALLDHHLNLPKIQKAFPVSFPMHIFIHFFPCSIVVHPIPLHQSEHLKHTFGPGFDSASLCGDNVHSVCHALAQDWQALRLSGFASHINGHERSSSVFGQTRRTRM